MTIWKVVVYNMDSVRDCFVIQNIRTGMPLFSHNLDKDLDTLFIAASLSAIQNVFSLFSQFTQLAQIVMTSKTDEYQISLNCLFIGALGLVFLTEGIPGKKCIKDAQLCLHAFKKQFRDRSDGYIDLEKYTDFLENPRFKKLLKSVNLKAPLSVATTIIPIAGFSSLGITKLTSVSLPSWISGIYNSKPSPYVFDKSFFLAHDSSTIGEKKVDLPANLLFSTIHVIRAFSKFFGTFDLFTIFIPHKRPYYLCVNPHTTLYENQTSTPGFGVLFWAKPIYFSKKFDLYKAFAKIIEGLETLEPKALLHNKYFLNANTKGSIDKILD